MRLRVSCVLLLFMVGCSGSDSNPPRASSPMDRPQPARRFVISYRATVPPCPSGAGRLDAWVPVPSSDSQQTISELSIKTDLPHQIETESEYHNRVLHVWNERPAPAQVELTFCCTRFEERATVAAGKMAVSHEPPPCSRDLLPDRLGVIDEQVRQTARQITQGKADVLTQAHAIYEYVTGHMAYDKTTPGWGRGDTARACAVGKGNCTDFHALFISLARARGIPARFGIGFQVPPAGARGAIEGYHCWAEFWLAGTGWVPVDCSEAWKHPDRRDFYFGSLDVNRVRLSIGRDVRLPAMSGPPLNFFLSPYAEASGRPAPIGTATVTFQTQLSSEVAMDW